MSSQIGTAYVRIVPSAQGISASTSKILNNQMGGVGQTAGATFGGAAVGAAAKYFGAAALGTALVQSIKAGGQLEQSIGGIETLFNNETGNAADIVIKNAERAWKTAGMSANDYMQNATSFSASLLNSLGGDTKKAAKITDMAIIDMSDNANKMGTDIDSIQNAYQGFAKQNYTMLDNLKLGFGGTKSEMLRLLDTASELTGKKYDISNLSDVYEAIHVIQEDMGITGTTAKEGASTLEGSFNAMKASADNFLGYLSAGENIKKPMKALVESAATFLFDNLVPALERVLVNLPDAIITLVQKGVPKLLQSIDKFIPQFFTALSKAWTKLYNGLTTWLNNLGNDPKAAQAGLKLVGSIAKGLAQGAWQLGTAILQGQGGLWKALGGLVFKMLQKGKQAGANLIKGIIQGVGDKVQGIVDTIKGYFPIKIGKILKGLKLPHFTLKMDKKSFGKLGTLKYPTGLGVKWYAKGGIFDSPTVAGIGEAGAEAVVPLKQLWNKFDALTQAVSGGGSGGTLNVVMTLDGQTIGQSSVDYINGQTIQFNASPLMI